MVGGADVSLQYPGSLGIGKGPKKFRRGQRRFGHAPIGAGTSNKVPNVGHSFREPRGLDRSDCWLDGDFEAGI